MIHTIFLPQPSKKKKKKTSKFQIGILLIAKLLICEKDKSQIVLDKIYENNISIIL